MEAGLAPTAHSCSRQLAVHHQGFSTEITELGQETARPCYTDVDPRKFVEDDHSEKLQPQFVQTPGDSEAVIVQARAGIEVKFSVS